MGRHGHVGYKAQCERVAIGLGFGYLLGAQVAARAGFVVHKNLLAQGHRQALRHNATQRVVAAARRIGNHQADGFAGVVLGQGVCA